MTITHLYRQYLRQIRRLPVGYLRQFFRLKAADDARAIARTNDPVKKLRRVCKDIRKVGAANQGNVKAFMHILDLAYGRKGKLRRELMEPLLSDPYGYPPPAAIIPSVEKSRPPVYSAELQALLTSPLSRTTKPLRPSALRDPPTLLAQAKFSSEGAPLYGSFSKRREVNIRWRYFTAEWNKVLPPLHKQREPSQEITEHHESQVTEVFKHIERLVGPSPKPLNLTRRESQRREVQASLERVNSDRHHQSRWLRRRYEQLLERIPILNYTQQCDKSNDSRTVITTTLSPRASRPSRRFFEGRISNATSEDILWLHSRTPDCTA